MTTAKRPRTGGTVDELWEEMGILEDVQELAIRKILALELDRAMTKQKMTKAELARKIDTSRAQLDKLLDPTSDGGITVNTLAKAARAIGKRIELKLVSA